jgi:hypothetical protein
LGIREVSQTRRRCRHGARAAGLAAVWLLLVCYPNPWIFLRNGLRYVHFPIDPEILACIPFPVPAAAAEIEAVVLDHVHYEYDWRQYSVPWYVPTPAEVVASGRGDCESRAVLLASLLAARHIPYRLQASPTHIWVDYPGKKPSVLENSAVAMMERKDGRYQFRWPGLLRVREDLEAQREALWDAMPPPRRFLLLAGWGALLLAALRRARQARPGPAGATSPGPLAARGRAAPGDRQSS